MDRQAVAVALVAVGLLASLPWPPPDAVGPAAAHDGDSLRVGGALHRLAGIDAPGLKRREWSNDGGPAARAYLAHLVRGGPVRCRVIGRGKFHRPIAVCVARETGALGPAMVAAGWARAIYFRADRPAWRPYAPLEDAARAAGLGVWARPPPLHP